MIRLRSLAPLNDVELDLISFVQTLVAIDLNGAVMNEDVCSAFAPEKAVAFRVVEPLHRTLELCQLSALLTLVGWAAGLGSGIGLGLPKVDVECAGMTQTDLFPRDVCLLRKEDVSLFYFGHNIRVSWDFPMMDAFAVDHLSDLEGKSTGSTGGCAFCAEIAFVKPVDPTHAAASSPAALAAGVPADVTQKATIEKTHAALNLRKNGQKDRIPNSLPFSVPILMEHRSSGVRRALVRLTQAQFIVPDVTHPWIHRIPHCMVTGSRSPDSLWARMTGWNVVGAML